MSELTPKQVADQACDMLTKVAQLSLRAGRSGATELPADVLLCADAAIACITLLQQYAESGSHVGASNQTGAAQ